MVLFATATSAAADTWTELTPTGTPPAPRYSAGSAYDTSNDRLILFSGQDATPLPRPTDVWVLTGATDAGGASSWVELFPSGGPPLGREGQTTVYDPVNNRVLVHGGCAGNCSPALADTWALEGANGLAGTPQWVPRQGAPLGRAEHAATFDPATGRMIVFGGHTGFFGTERNDVHVYDSGADSWSQLLPVGSPPPVRRWAGVAYDEANNRMILFGGVNVPNSVTFNYYNDVWVLTNANGLGGSPEWMQLAPTGTPPAPRGGHSALYDPLANRLIVFGGTDVNFSTNVGTNYSDTRVLENANGLGGTPHWTQLAPTGGPPPGRQFHSAGYSSASQRLAVAMGRGGPGGGTLFNDAWSLSLNEPPDCSGADPSVSTLWPPNHRLVPVTVNGVTDPDGDAVTITVASIHQDEPTSGTGPDDLSPDGTGVGTSPAQLRAERALSGDGSVYHVAFTADDGKGGSCLGVVTVGVPHNQGKGNTPIDDGALFDSTV